MLNQYVNLTPQQKLAQMLQQQSQPSQLQGQQEMGQQAAQNPFSGAQDAMKMYGQASQQAEMQNYKDYMGRLKLGQNATGGMFDSANAAAPAMTANNYTG